MSDISSDAKIIFAWYLITNLKLDICSDMDSGQPFESPEKKNWTGKVGARI